MSRALIIAYLPASDNGLSYRGTENALLDYMEYAQILLGHSSILCLESNARNDPNVLEKFKSKFKIVKFINSDDLEEQLLKLNVDALYSIRANPIKGLILKQIPMLIHAVYDMNPRGTELVCAGVSESVASVGENKNSFVPHIVSVNSIDADYRTYLNIPDTAIVFGRHGGADTFDIPWVRDVILKLLSERDDIYFLFITRPYMFQNVSHPRLICFEPFFDSKIKRKFINTCSAMIHAQTLGETFGLSIAEFSMSNKPVITWNGGKVQEHLRILGDKCLKYNNANDLYKLLSEFNPSNYSSRDWKAYHEYIPEIVMRQFDSVFLNPLRKYLKLDLISKNSEISKTENNEQYNISEPPQNVKKFLKDIKENSPKISKKFLHINDAFELNNNQFIQYIDLNMIDHTEINNLEDAKAAYDNIKLGLIPIILERKNDGKFITIEGSCRKELARILGYSYIPAICL